jgi:putative peptide zinc metalloprotease protein
VTDTRHGPGDGPVPTPAAERGALRRASGVQLIGAMAGSGYRVPPSLAQRSDGQTVQLTPLLYAVLEAIDGQRGPQEVARAVSQSTGRTVSPSNVETLVDEQLRPLGLLVRPDGSEPELKRSNPLLGLRLRYSVTDPERTQRLTAPFARLFHPIVAVPLLAAFALVCWWVFFRQGLAGAAYDAFQHPGLLMLVFAVTVLSAGFHEFGHAAAARYGGARPGAMGAGVYLVWPAFYTDVTDSYRLGKGGRVRTDLGGLYFNAIVAVAVAASWWVTGYEALLLLVATQVMQMLQQLTPLVRFDGYHVLADVTGVPDLFHRIKPTLLGVLPWRWGDPEARLLKPWARAVVTLWVVVVVPVLLAALLAMVLTLPRLLGTAWARLALEQGRLAEAAGAADWLQVAARALTMLAVVLPVAAIVYMLVRLARQASRGVWKKTAGRPVQRTSAAIMGMAILAGLVFAWWPRPDTYRPIQPDERGTVTDLVQPVSALARPAPTTWAAGDQGTVRTVWDTTRPLPTEGQPQLALVAQPRSEDGAPTVLTGTGGEGATSDTEQPEAWVFPFDQPLAPEPGDNQALAVNTEDGTVEYDVAIAMVWIEDGDDVLNANEAYAFASCETCATVAVAFQVVFVIGDNDAVAPQNIAAAVNYDCANCLTYALAQQLLVTLDGPLSDEAMEALDLVWAQLAELAETIASIPLDDIDDRLDEIEDAILDIIEADQPGTVPSQPSSPVSPSDAPSSAPSGEPDDSPTDSPSDPPTSQTPGSSPTESSEQPTESESPSSSESGSATDPSSGPTSESSS